MTRAEFYAKYGDVRVTFSHYYKFTFTYVGELPDGKISVDYGGNSGDIYRHEVGSGSAETISSLQPYAGEVYRDGKQVESFYDY